MVIIKLKSSDGEIFDTDVEIAKCSGTIKTMLEDCGMDEQDGAIIPLPNVNSTILRLILQWADYHKNDPVVDNDKEKKEKSTKDIPEWDKDFLKIEQSTIFEIILAANYLDIKGLMESACRTVADIIKGKTPEEIRSTFDIESGFTPEEEEKIRQEEEWCKEQN